MGYIKQLKGSNLNTPGVPSNAIVYPVTATSAVFDTNGLSLDKILKNLPSRGGIGGDNGGGGGSSTPNIKVVTVTLYASGDSDVKALTNALISSGITRKNGSYSFEENLLTFDTSNSGWQRNTNGLTLSSGIYSTTRTFFSNGNSSEWTLPALSTNKYSVIPTNVSYYVTIFASGETYPSLKMPNGNWIGSYDYDTKQLDLSGTNWHTDTASLSGKIWYTWGTYYNDEKGKWFSGWATPIRLITSESIINNVNSFESYGVSIFKCWHETNTPNNPSGGSFDYALKVLAPPSSWYTTINLAIENAGIDGMTGQKYNTVWVSYRYYTKSGDNESSTNWTTPIKYININDILNKASEKAQEAILEGLKQADSDLNKGLRDVLEGIFGESDGINELIKQLLNITSNFTGASAIINSLKKMYSWQLFDKIPDELIATPILHSNLEAFVNSNEYNESDYYDRFISLNNGNGPIYRYTMVSATLADLLSKLLITTDDQGKTILQLNTAVNELTPDKIRLQVSETVLNGESIRINLTEEEYDTFEESKKLTTFTDPPTEIEYGIAYKFNDGGTFVYFRYEKPIKTSFVNILKDLITLGAVESDERGAVIRLGFNDDGDSSTEVTSKEFVINGTTIALAIEAEELNIGNGTTILNGDGTAMFGMPTETDVKQGSVFNCNGTGYIAGGAITWGNDENDKFNFTVSGIVNAEAGFIGKTIYYETGPKDVGWTIGVIGKGEDLYAALIGTGNNGKSITMSPYELRCGVDYESNTSDTKGWYLRHDGSARFGDLANGENSQYIEVYNGNVNITGTINAENGYFKGDVVANSLSVNLLGNGKFSIVPYSSIKDKIPSGTVFLSGTSTGKVLDDNTPVICIQKIENGFTQLYVSPLIRLDNGYNLFSKIPFSNETYKYIKTASISTLKVSDNEKFSSVYNLSTYNSNYIHDVNFFEIDGVYYEIPLNKLSSYPNYDESFINTIKDSCYKANGLYVEEFILLFLLCRIGTTSDYFYISKIKLNNFVDGKFLKKVFEYENNRTSEPVQLGKGIIIYTGYKTVFNAHGNQENYAVLIVTNDDGYEDYVINSLQNTSLLLGLVTNKSNDDNKKYMILYETDDNAYIVIYNRLINDLDYGLLAIYELLVKNQSEPNNY